LRKRLAIANYVNNLITMSVVDYGDVGEKSPEIKLQIFKKYLIV